MRGQPGRPFRLPGDFRSRLLVLVVALVAVISAPVYLYVNHVLSAQLLRDRGTALDALAISVASTMAQNLQERQQELALLADSNLLQAGATDTTDLTRRLNALQASRAFYSWLSFSERDGHVKAASGNLLVGTDVRARPWFHGGEQAPYLGNVHAAVLLGKLLPAEPDNTPVRFVDMAVPVHNAQGQPIGVLGAHLNWRWAGETIRQLIPPAAAQAGLEVLLVDRQGTVLYPAALFGHHANLDGSEPASNRSVRGTTHLTANRKLWQNRYLASSVAVREVLAEHPLGWHVLVRQPMETTLTDVTALQNVVLVSVLLAALLFLLAAWWTMGQISRPLEDLVRYAASLTSGTIAEPLNLQRGSTEIRKLTRAIHHMAVTLLQREVSLQTANQRLEAEVRARTAKLHSANLALEQLAAHDHLTGLHNRRAASERLHLEFLRLRRHQTPYVVLLLDIDHFKQINDRFGHAVGDEVLRQLADLLRHALRETDFVARFGGEEFLVLLPDTWHAAGHRVADKLRQAVADASFTGAGRVTVSVGLAVAVASDDGEDCAVTQADLGLYLAKAEGRNRVCAAPREETPSFSSMT